MLGLQVLHGAAGDPPLARAPKPAKPYASDWGRAEVEFVVAPVDPNRNSSPPPTAALGLHAMGTLCAEDAVVMPGDPYVDVYSEGQNSLPFRAPRLG